MDVGRKIFETLLHRVKPGECPEQGKVRSPDMRRDIDCLRTQFQQDLQQVMTVQPQDRAAVRMDIPDLLQFRRYLLRVLKPGEQDQAVDLAHFSIFLINRTDLPCDHKAGDHLTGHFTVLNPVFLLQNIKPVLCRFQLFCQLLPPRRVGKVPCPHDVDPFPSRPEVEILRRTVLAGRPGIAGMDM